MASIKPEQLGSGSYSISGSFSGSFQGDGSGLVGVSSSNLGDSNLIISDVTRSLLFGPSTTNFYIANNDNTFNFLEIDNVGNTYIRNSSNVNFELGNGGRSYFKFVEDGYNTSVPSPATFTQFNSSHRFKLNILSGDGESKLEMQQGNFGFGTSFTIGTNLSETNTLIIPNGTSPTSGGSNLFKLYSSDVSTSNAAPHFLTEAGDLIKLYTELSVTSSQGIADALTSIGLLDSSSIQLIGDGSQLTNLQRPISNSVSTNITASDLNAGYYFRVGGNITCSIQTSSLVNCAVGSEFEFFQTSSTGNMLFLSGSGVTLNSKGGNLSLTGQFSAATLKKIDNDEWDLIGDLS